MTTFIVGIEERYQFVHLSIQEALAAWWIAQYETTEEVFAVADVYGRSTHLEHESYEQYFNKELDLQCKRRQLFGFEKCYYSHLRKNSVYNCSHVSCDQIQETFLNIAFFILFVNNFVYSLCYYTTLCKISLLHQLQCRYV